MPAHTAPEPLSLPELPPQPTISIAITAYNYGSFLPECLDSCLRQTVWVDQIVVVDDGSTDDTQRVLAEYGSRFPNIVGIRQSNRGMCAAMNTALAHCAGDIVLLLDSDDVIVPQRVERVIEALRQPIDGRLPGWVHHYLMRFADGRPEIGLAPHYGATAPRGMLAEAVVHQAGSPVHTMTSGLAFRREVLAAMGPLDERRHMTQDHQMRTGAALLSPLAWIPEALTRYRLHGGSDSSTLMLTSERVARIRDCHVGVDVWVRRLLERRQAGLSDAWRPLDDQPAYLWLSFLQRWWAGERRDYALLRRIIDHPDTRHGPRLVRWHYRAGLYLPKSLYVAYLRFVFGYSPLKSFIRTAIGRSRS
jgi:glycosyltransferase involved in cell wall biosynthesis